jgi:hypothetical protein
VTASARLFFVMLAAMLGVLTQSGMTAHAHSQSYGYLNVSLDGPKVAGKLEAAVRDLDRLYRLDGNGDGTITWGEFRLREGEITRAALQTISLSVPSGACSLAGLPALTDSHGGETYIVFPFASDCSASGGALDVDYRLLFDIDAQHRGLVSIATADGNSNYVVTPAQPHISLNQRETTLVAQAASYAGHGVHHILIGYDHILFVLTLLLGTAVQQRAQSLARTFLETAKVVTAFTLSHSVTLGLAALGFLDIPSIVAESLIAATIALAAVNNVWPFMTRKLWLVALVFGLIHGVGFASVLTSLGLPRDNLLVSLLAFNVGVEAGQLLVVAVALPVIAIAVRQGISRFAVPAANGAITIAALLWLSDRALGTALMPF